MELRTCKMVHLKPMLSVHYNYSNSLMHSLYRNLSSADNQSNLLPPINVNIVATGKLTGHMKRRYHDQVSRCLGTVD